MIAQMKDVPLEFGDFGVMPCYKKVPQTHRVRRFQLGKLKLMLKDIEEEKTKIRQRADDEADAVAESLRETQEASRNLTADALSQLGDDTPKPANDPDGAATTHAAQLTALQAADGASAGSSEASISAATSAALQRRASKKISPRPLNAPMAVVPEEQPQPSEAGSYRSVEESEKPEEQSEPPPEE
eukprot:5965714-Amphidinium_carterae.1